MKNYIDLYNSHKKGYDKYTERKYMILKYFPSCNGNVLDVGKHKHNKNDYVCFKKEVHYESIDIANNCKQWCLNHKHTTIDFLNYRPDYKLNHIILFGVYHTT